MVTPSARSAASAASTSSRRTRKASCTLAAPGRHLILERSSWPGQRENVAADAELDPLSASS